MLKIGEIVSCEVVKIQKTYFLITTNNDNQKWLGLINISNISDYFISDINQYFKVGQKVYLKIIEINSQERKLKLNFKSINPLFQRNPFGRAIKETKKGFNSLLLANNMIVKGEVW